MERKQLIKSALFLFLLIGLMFGGSWRATRIDNPLFRGETMGTTYSIRLIGTLHKNETARLAEKMDQLLLELNQSMSTWIEDSEICKFNYNLSTEPVVVSESFYTVTKKALELAKKSNGAFDPTLQPLLNAWGFGSESSAETLPSSQKINRIHDQTGWRKIEALAGNRLRKEVDNVSLALGAIAKGHGVDLLAELMINEGYTNWFIEVGGEVRVLGKNSDGVPWKIGIQSPDVHFLDMSLHGIAQLTEGSVATSGSYRNYMEKDGKRYAHILDPRTGQAILSNLLSVSVLSENCMDADGWATALYVLGVDEGLLVVESNPGLEALFITGTNDGDLKTSYSSGFLKKTDYQPIKKPRQE
mgnify:FL=1